MNRYAEILVAIENTRAAMMSDILAQSRDNPKIDRINEVCFTIKSSDLGSNWSPFYHDHKAQYDFIITKLADLGIPEGLSFLQDDVVKRGRWRQTGYYFAPEVREQIKNILCGGG